MRTLAKAFATLTVALVILFVFGWIVGQKPTMAGLTFVLAWMALCKAYDNEAKP